MWLKVDISHVNHFLAIKRKLLNNQAHYVHIYYFQEREEKGKSYRILSENERNSILRISPLNKFNTSYHPKKDILVRKRYFHLQPANQFSLKVEWKRKSLGTDERPPPHSAISLHFTNLLSHQLKSRLLLMREMQFSWGIWFSSFPRISACSTSGISAHYQFSSFIFDFILFPFISS